MTGERRTRAEKSRTQLHRQDQLTYSFHSDRGVEINTEFVQQDLSRKAAQKEQSKKPKLAITDLFSYDVHLIYRDLIKTAVITSLIMLAVIGLKFGLR